LVTTLATPLGMFTFLGTFLDILVAFLADKILLIGLSFANCPQDFLLAAAALVVVIVRDRGHGQQKRRQNEYQSCHVAILLGG
jgi:hypothetical protein